MDLNNREIEVKIIGFCLLLWFFYLEKLGVKKQNFKNVENLDILKNIYFVMIL